MSVRSRIGLALLLAPLLWCAGPIDARAEPLTFEGTHFVINSSPERLDLFANPGVVLEPRTYGGTFFPPTMIFGAFVTHEGGESFTDTILFTYHEEGAAPVMYSQTFTTGVDPITLGFAVNFDPVHRTGKPVPTTLTVGLVNSAPDFVIPGGPDAGGLVDSFTYSFYTVAPVPEPSTLLLLASGAAALSPRARRLLQDRRRRQD